MRKSNAVTMDWKTRFAALLAALVLGLSAADAAAIEFHKSLDQARKADAGGKPVVVQFGAAWCGWCRKMSANTFVDKKVEEVSSDYVWVEIDIDDEPELAARFQVESVPHTVVLDGKGRLLGSRGGYLPADEFVAFLDESRNNPQPEEIVSDLIEQFLAAEQRAERKDAIERMVAQLARPSRVGRDEILDAFDNKGLTTWPVLVDLLADKRLAVRAAAAGALRRSTRADLRFLPFAPLDQREQQISAWRQWVDEHTPEAEATR